MFSATERFTKKDQKMKKQSIVRAGLAVVLLGSSVGVAVAAAFTSSNGFVGATPADNAAISHNGYRVINTSANWVNVVADLGSITGVTSVTGRVYGASYASAGSQHTCWLTATDTSDFTQTFAGASTQYGNGGAPNFGLAITTSGLTSSRTYALGVFCELPPSAQTVYLTAAKTPQ
jgi:hypothetical protein